MLAYNFISILIIYTLAAYGKSTAGLTTGQLGHLGQPPYRSLRLYRPQAKNNSVNMFCYVLTIALPKRRPCLKHCHSYATQYCYYLYFVFYFGIWKISRQIFLQSRSLYRLYIIVYN